MRHNLATIAAVVCIFLAALVMPGALAEAQPAQLTDVTVTDVVDGDTVDVSPPVQGVDRVRLIGVNTPEVFGEGAPEPCGPEASDFTRQQLEGRQVGLEFDQETIDPFERALAYVWVGDELFNETLVREGLAEVDTFPPNDKYESRFMTAEEQAVVDGLGIWGPDGCNTDTGAINGGRSGEPAGGGGGNQAANERGEGGRLLEAGGNLPPSARTPSVLPLAGFAGGALLVLAGGLFGMGLMRK